MSLGRLCNHVILRHLQLGDLEYLKYLILNLTLQLLDLSPTIPAPHVQAPSTLAVAARASIHPTKSIWKQRVTDGLLRQVRCQTVQLASTFESSRDVSHTEPEKGVVRQILGKA